MTPATLAIVVAVASCSAHAPPLDRVAAWRDDLRVFATELPQRHKNAFFHADETTWRRGVADLDHQLEHLDDAHVIAGIMRLAAALGDGHTLARAPGRAAMYPLSLIWFADGIFVRGAPDDAHWAVGAKLVAVGERPIAESIVAVTPLIAHDNDADLHAMLPGFLVDPIVLVGADLVTGDRVTYHLVTRDGSARDLDLAAGLTMPPVAPPAVAKLPLHLQGPNTAYWNKDVDGLLYLAYNRCADDPRVGPFDKFAAVTLAYVDGHHIDRFVIDLRNNGGGNSRIIDPLLDGLASRPALAGRVFAIIGMHTFSSAVLNAMELRRRVHATLVGGPTGGKPSHYGEVKTFELPHSKLLVQYSTKFFEYPDFPGDSVQPDLAVTVRAADWFEGRDPAIDAIVAAPPSAASARTCSRAADTGDTPRPCSGSPVSPSVECPLRRRSIGTSARSSWSSTPCAT
ncbi:MAG: hypothetical protein ABJE66_30795 [Deltaproteobacteria bacterium]